MGVIMLAAILITSCEKDNTCRAIVTAIDINGVPVSGVNIKLWIPSSLLEYPNQETISWPQAITTSNGQAAFNFKNESVLEIEATKGGLYGTGFIVLKQGVLVQQQVILN